MPHNQNSGYSLLLIDSNDLNSDNQLTFDNKIQGDYQLETFVFTNNLYNVDDTNNKVYINENSNNLTATLTNGFYDSNDFRTQLQTQMNAVCSGTISITLDDNTGKLAISNDTHNFYFTFATNTTNSARKLMGFNQSDGTNASSQTSDIAMDLNTHKCFFVNIEENNNKNIDSPSYFNTSLLIQATGSFGETARHIKNDNFNQYVKFRNEKKIKFKIHDKSNNTLDLQSEWFMVLRQL